MLGGRELPILLTLFLGISPFCSARDMVLISGEKYLDVKLKRVSDESVTIFHKDGMATVKYSEMSPESVKAFEFQDKLSSVELSREEAVEMRIAKQLKLLQFQKKMLKISDTEKLDPSLISDFDLISIKVTKDGSLRRIPVADMPEETAFLLGFDMDLANKLDREREKLRKEQVVKLTEMNDRRNEPTGVAQDSHSHIVELEDTKELIHTLRVKLARDLNKYIAKHFDDDDIEHKGEIWIIDVDGRDIRIDDAIVGGPYHSENNPEACPIFNWRSDTSLNDARMIAKEIRDLESRR
jgi:hypothetical protein